MLSRFSLLEFDKNELKFKKGTWFDVHVLQKYDFLSEGVKNENEKKNYF